MKINIRHLLMALLFIPFILISCKTTGTDTTASLTDAVVQQDLEGPVDEAALSALAQAKADAKESRSWAEYVKGNVYYPNEWNLAEGRYKEADSRGDEPETKAEAYVQVTEWKGIKLLYDDIFNKSSPQFAGEQEKMLAEVREEAVEAGAQALVPDRFAQVDALTASAKKKYESGDFAGSVKEGREARDRYLVLQTLAQARAKQESSDEYDFFSLDEENYILAANAGNNSVDLFDEGKLTEAQAEADKALELFNQVYKNGWYIVVDEKASVARDWKAASDDIKASVAVRSDYAAAEQVYNNAHVALRAENYSEAMKLFEQSGELYMIAHDNALEKRHRAEEALLAAEKKLAESEEKAQNADDIIGGNE